MRPSAIVTLVLALTLLQAVARESIQQGEEAGIPDRADVDKKGNDPLKKQAEREKKKEARQNQEETDPVFYDSTTSPKEMEQKKMDEP